MGQNLYRLGAHRRHGGKSQHHRRPLKGRIDIKGAGGIRDLATVRALYQLGVRRFGMSHGAVTKVLAELEQHPERFPELNAD